MVKTIQEWDPSFIRALKDREDDEDTDYEQQMAHCEKNSLQLRFGILVAECVRYPGALCQGT